MLKILIILATLFLYSCSSLIPQAGPSTYAIRQDDSIVLIDLSPQLVAKIKQEKSDIREKIRAFLSEPYSPSIGKGDLLEVIIYESPPAVLLASNPSTVLLSGGVASLSIPPQLVDDAGYINVPFVGRIYVLGKRPEEVAKEIEEKLSRKANKPQVIVRFGGFNSSTVTVFGHVKESRKVPLSYNTTTILDVLASVGGVTSPIEKTLIQISRNGKEITLPLEEILQNPELNINLKPGDVIRVIYQTKSATILGATGKNMELEFEAKGISLSQALGRAGGLRDDIAHAKGLFIFRFEDKEVLDKLGITYQSYTKDGKVPVVYNIDLSNPASVFVLRDFEVKDKDIIYVSTAPAVQLGKFLSIVRDVIQPIFMIKVLTR